MNKLQGFIKDESGVTAIEYSLIAGTMGLLLVAVMPQVQAALNGKYTAIANAM